MNNRKIFIFDVDGTLTPSRLPMTKEFQTFFSDWVKQNTFYLVTGSDLPKLQEQMNGMEIHSNGIFTCCGNQFWETDYAVHPKHADLIYENKFKIPQTLLTYLGLQVRLSDTPVMSTNHREDRGSMLNFSVVGRNCTQEQREEYFEWDNKVGERRKIANEIMSGWPELEAVLGGQISIDIYPKGKDKSQIYEHLEENDYPLAKLMEETSSCNYYRTKGWEHTQQILENLID
jgi:phosphomannomutase